MNEVHIKLDANGTEIQVDESGVCLLGKVFISTAISFIEINIGRKLHEKSIKTRK